MIDHGEAERRRSRMVEAAARYSVQRITERLEREHPVVREQWLQEELWIQFAAGTLWALAKIAESSDEPVSETADPDDSTMVWLDSTIDELRRIFPHADEYLRRMFPSE